MTESNLEYESIAGHDENARPLLCAERAHHLTSVASFFWKCDENNKSVQHMHEYSIHYRKKIYLRAKIIHLIFYL